MSDERHIETIEGLYKRLKWYVDNGYGGCKIRCFDGYLYDDAYQFNPQDRIYEICGFYSDTDLGSKTEKLIKDIMDAQDEYRTSLENAYAHRRKDKDGLTNN